MSHSTILAILIVGVSYCASAGEDQNQRAANNQHLATFNDSGGWAYWHDSKRGQDPHGTELMVRRCNRPELRVSTKPLFHIQGISKLILHGVDFTDAELDGISEMKDLPSLLIDGKITDDGLRHLAGMTSLKELWIYQTKVDGTGLRHLKKLDQLEFLYIDSDLSDDGLSQLAQMTRIKRLSVPGLKVDQLEKLRRALPDTEIDD